MRLPGASCISVSDSGSRLEWVPPRLALASDLAWPGLGLAWPFLAWPGLIWPGLAWPGLAWPGLAWPSLAWPGGLPASIHHCFCIRTELGSAGNSGTPGDVQRLQVKGTSGDFRLEDFRGLHGCPGLGTLGNFSGPSLYLSPSLSLSLSLSPSLFLYIYLFIYICGSVLLHVFSGF